MHRSTHQLTHQLTHPLSPAAGCTDRASKSVHQPDGRRRLRHTPRKRRSHTSGLVPHSTRTHSPARTPGIRYLWFARCLDWRRHIGKSQQVAGNAAYENQNQPSIPRFFRSPFQAQYQGFVFAPNIISFPYPPWFFFSFYRRCRPFSGARSPTRPRIDCCCALLR